MIFNISKNKMFDIIKMTTVAISDEDFTKVMSTLTNCDFKSLEVITKDEGHLYHKLIGVIRKIKDDCTIDIVNNSFDEWFKDHPVENYEIVVSGFTSDDIVNDNIVHKVQEGYTFEFVIINKDGTMIDNEMIDFLSK